MQVNEIELREQAQKLAVSITAPKTIYLQGDLGAGKTTFCRAFIQALGHVGSVKSPTYTLVEPYHLDGVSIYHCDLYRLAGGEELELLGFRDFLNENSLLLIEWPEKAEGYLPKADILIELSHAGEERELVIHTSD